jgi:hypothetical protein
MTRLKLSIIQQKRYLQLFYKIFITVFQAVMFCLTFFGKNLTDDLELPHE